MIEPVIFMFCLTLHNIEEALWFTEWRIKTMPNSRKSPQKLHFIFAVLGITILGYLASGLHIMYLNNTIIKFCYIGFVGAMHCKCYSSSFSTYITMQEILSRSIYRFFPIDTFQHYYSL